MTISTPTYDQLCIDVVLLTMLSFGGAIGGYLSAVQKFSAMHNLSADGLVSAAVQNGMQRIPKSKILLGCVGAIVIVTIAPMDNLLDQIATNGWRAHDFIGLIALALVGGYAGGALLEASAGRFVAESIRALDNSQKKTENALEEFRKKTRHESDAATTALQFTQRILNGYKLDDSEIPQFNQALKDADSKSRSDIARLADENRRQNWKDDKEHMERSLLIFKALVACPEAKEYHWWHAWLGFCFKDKAEPEYDRAAECLDQAIKIRGAGEQVKSGAYEFNRAVVNIRKSMNKPIDDDLKSVKKKIEKDLEAASGHPRWNRIIDEDKDRLFQKWNSRWVPSTPPAKSLRKSAGDVISMLSTKARDSAGSSTAV
jgi:hypothetical protein